MYELVYVVVKPVQYKSIAVSFLEAMKPKSLQLKCILRKAVYNYLNSVMYNTCPRADPQLYQE